MDDDLLGRNPVTTAVLGACVIAFSAIIVRAADVSPSTSALFRCAYAVPVLLPLAIRERRRFGPRRTRDRRLGIAAGVVFGVNLVLFHHAIGDVGAGLSTVLGNLQVVVVALLAWLTLGERPGRRMAVAIPAVLLGAVLISGVLEGDAFGADPARGTLYAASASVLYGAFILLLRITNASPRQPAGPLLDATATAAVTILVVGLALDTVDVVPSWPAHGWLLLLALSSQVVGWLLISTSLPRLPTALTALLLLIQPVAAVALAALLFSEAPTPLQLGGVACVLAAVVYAARGRRPSPEPLTP